MRAGWGRTAAGGCHPRVSKVSIRADIWGSLVLSPGAIYSHQSHTLSSSPPFDPVNPSPHHKVISPLCSLHDQEDQTMLIRKKEGR